MADLTPPAASGRIFISYRREETAYPAGWLYERLAERFGAGQVFKDVDSIQLGDDFVEVITRAVGSCDVLLALIGDEWLRISDSYGRRRIDDPEDFVRLEIEAALTREVRVIPILVDGASMPSADELPDSLTALVRRQALELSPSRFEFDTNRLFRVVDWTLADVRTAQDAAADEPTQVAEPPRTAAGETRTTPASDGARPVAASKAARGDAARQTGAELDSDRRGAKETAGRLRARPWILAGIGAGIVLVIVIAVVVANSLRPPTPGGSAADGQVRTTGGIDVDSSTVTSPEDLQLGGLTAVSRREPDPPQVGDTVTVNYSLTNVGEQPVQLAYTFVGVRDPADSNRDTEDVNEGATLKPGETVKAQGRVLLDAAGGWQLWPCYALSDGTLCPDKWRVFFVLTS
jgi:hypothetical protein